MNAGSGLAHENTQEPQNNPVVNLYYVCQWDSAGTLARTVSVQAADNQGQIVVGPEQEELALPEPFRHVDKEIGGIYTEYFEDTPGEVVDGLVAPLPWPINFTWSWVKVCTLFEQSGLWTVYGTIMQDLTVQGWALAQFTFRGWTEEINQNRTIPLRVGKPTPGVSSVTGQVWTADGMRTVTMELKEEHPRLMQVFQVAPLRTDLDMEISGMGTFGVSKRQQCAPYFIDVAPGTKVTITCRLPGLPEGFQGLNADRTVYLSYPEGCFTSEEPSAQTKKGNEDLIWHLTRTEQPMAMGATIRAWSDSTAPGHPDVIPLSIGGVEVRPGAFAEGSPGNDEGAAKVGLIIKRDGVDITGQTTSVLVGERMNLEAEVGGPQVEIRTWKWTIPNEPLESWTPNKELSLPPFPLLDFLMAEQKVSFFWSKGAEGVKVKCEAMTDEGTVLAGQTTFNVIRPEDSSVVAGVQAIQVSLDAAGKLDVRYPMEMTYTSTEEMMDGQIEWVQVVNGELLRVRDFAGKWYRAEAVGTKCDGKYPVKGPLYVIDEDKTWQDKPGPSGIHAAVVDEPLESWLAEVQVEQQFSTWLMFRPSPWDEWVPLRRVDWAWSAVAAGPPWALKEHDTPQPTDQDSNVYPTWAGWRPTPWVAVLNEEAQ